MLWNQHPSFFSCSKLLEVRSINTRGFKWIWEGEAPATNSPILANVQIRHRMTAVPCVVSLCVSQDRHIVCCASGSFYEGERIIQVVNFASNLMSLSPACRQVKLQPYMTKRTNGAWAVVLYPQLWHEPDCFPPFNRSVVRLLDISIDNRLMESD